MKIRITPALELEEFVKNLVQPRSPEEENPSEVTDVLDNSTTAREALVAAIHEFDLGTSLIQLKTAIKAIYFKYA
ncbi:5767_t:CDS:2 [Funneliformis geosporum]|uniref:5767_t:CDS:1 n=1 Tax=Funneliformis geosporum TaxID=1117311 RepID=A0A9W4WWU1_9GLOM|nr:5767_t:CDS:2 [Funneliformis geosporum]